MQDLTSPIESCYTYHHELRGIMMFQKYLHSPNVHVHLCDNDIVCLSGYCRSGKYHEFTVGKENLENYNGGALIQDAFPGLNSSEREFLMTGMCCDPLWDNIENGEE